MRTLVGGAGLSKVYNVAMLLCVMEENVAAALSLQICKKKRKKEKGIIVL